MSSIISKLVLFYSFTYIILAHLMLFLCVSKEDNEQSSDLCPFVTLQFLKRLILLVEKRSLNILQQLYKPICSKLNELILIKFTRNINLILGSKWLYGMFCRNFTCVVLFYQNAFYCY